MFILYTYETILLTIILVEHQFRDQVWLAWHHGMSVRPNSLLRIDKLVSNNVGRMSGPY